MHVLLIEDNEDDALLIREMLAEVKGGSLPAGTFDLEWANGLSAGLERLAEEGIDVVLLDLGLPDSQGLKTLVKVQTQVPEVPIVVLTGLADETLGVKAVQEGAQDYLVKGQVDGNLLVRSMRYAIERKRAEEALREYSERLEEMVDERTKELRELLKQVERAKQEWESTADSLPDLVCLIDDRGRIIRANRIVETWNLGRVVDVKGQGVHELLHPGCADSSCYLDSFWKQAWEEAIRGQPARCEAYDEVLKRHVLVQVQPSKGTATGFTVVVVRDITERVRAQEALREYSERLEEMVDDRTKELRDAQERLLRAERLAAVGQLGASVGHELRNPLGVIKNSVYYLNMKLRDADEKVKKHLKIMERAIARSNKIISDLMDFARIREPTLQETDVNFLVKEALSRSQVSEKVEVVTRLEEGLPSLMADPGQIEQVFINLILNAAQAMTSSSSVETPDGGRLEIATRAEDGFIVTEFKDNGCGISEENLGRLFTPLFTTKARGIGLGLAISKNIVEAHEGSIEVESPSRGLRTRTERVEVTGEGGKGTTFRVKLPISGS